MLIEAGGFAFSVLECQMKICSCPHGRAYFEESYDLDPLPGEAPFIGKPYRPWSPSPDRFPIPGRKGGLYTADNVRLAHLRCNIQDGGRAGGSVGGPLYSKLRSYRRLGRALAASGYHQSKKGLEDHARAGKKGGPIGGPRSARAQVDAGRWKTKEGLEQLSRMGRLGGRALADSGWHRSEEGHKAHIAMGHAGASSWTGQAGLKRRQAYSLRMMGNVPWNKGKKKGDC
jgi:hypothetical protein